jgi:hypothetical protein
MSDNITRIEDARALKRMGMPANMPVKQMEFSSEYTRLWLDLMRGYERFAKALLRYIDDNSPGKWRQIKRRLADLKVTILGCVGPVRQLDEPEQTLLKIFLAERAGPFVDYWDGVAAAIDDGNSVPIDKDDIPKWIDTEGAVGNIA